MALGPKLGSRNQPTATPATIEPRLKKLEAMAGTPNTFFAFNMPITRAASDTRRMNGYITRVSVMVSSAFSPWNPGASHDTSQGADNMPAITSALKTMVASRCDFVCQPPSSCVTLEGGRLRERGDERRGQRPFGEQIAQKVRYPERDGETRP